MTSLRIRKRYALLLGVLGLLGCSSGKPATTGPAAPETAEERLTAIGKAYLKAASRLGKPPRGAEDIKDDVEGGFTPELLRSPNDNEPFVILWGVDLNKLPKSGDAGPILAYEKRGKEGKRFVLRYPLAVAQLSEEEFSKAPMAPVTPP